MASGDGASTCGRESAIGGRILCVGDSQECVTNARESDRGGYEAVFIRGTVSGAPDAQSRTMQRTRAGRSAGGQLGMIVEMRNRTSEVKYEKLRGRAAPRLIPLDIIFHCSEHDLQGKELSDSEVVDVGSEGEEQR